MSITVIAEVGECFNGNMEAAHKMIHVAKIAGCNIVKFQLLDMDEVSKDDPEYGWFEKLDLAPPRLNQLIEWAKDEDIEILFTPVSIKTARWLVDAKIKSVKIASSFVRKTELLEYINGNFDTVYISTGMAALEEIDNVISILNKVEDISILHCISEYPTGPLLEKRGLKALDEEDVHLNMMTILQNRYPQYRIGYSDHTQGIFAATVAAAMGAEVIEKHFTLDRDTPIKNFKEGKTYMGTDHILSSEPNELSEMVKNIRQVEIIKGDMEWRRSEGELALIDFLRGRYSER